MPQEASWKTINLYGKTEIHITMLPFCSEASQEAKFLNGQHVKWVWSFMANGRSFLAVCQERILISNFLPVLQFSCLNIQKFKKKTKTLVNQ